MTGIEKGDYMPTRCTTHPRTGKSSPSLPYLHMAACLCSYMCLYLCICACMCVCMGVCICAYVCVCVLVSVHICVLVCACMCAHMCALPSLWLKPKARI